MNKLTLAEYIILKIRMSATRSINVFLYFLKSLPIFKQTISDRVYSYCAAKTAFAIIGALLSVTKKLVANLFVSFIVFGISAALSPTNASTITMFVPVFTAFSLAAAVLVPRAYSPTEALYTEVRIMHIDARLHSIVHIFLSSAFTAICYYPSMLLMMLFTSLGAELLLLPLIWYAVRLCVFACDLFIKDKKSRLGLPLCILALLFAVAMPVLVSIATSQMPSTGIFLLASIIILIILSVPAAIYMLKYNGYHRLIVSECTAEKLQSIDDAEHNNALSVGSAENKSTFKDVEIPDKYSKQSQSSIPMHGMSPAAYLTRVFFKRHTWLLLKPAVITSVVIAAIYVVVTVVGYCFVPELFETIVQSIAFIYPALAFVLYFISTSPKACKAMFYNCDISLLHMPFYREPRLLLSVFGRRLSLTAVINAVPALVLGISLGALNLQGGGGISDSTLLLLTALMLSLFFTVYHLSMYYLFQPYTTSLDTKNPFFTISNLIIYIICYSLFQIEIPIYGFAYVELGITVLAIALSLAAVYKFAPKRFRIK